MTRSQQRVRDRRGLITVPMNQCHTRAHAFLYIGIPTQDTGRSAESPEEVASGVFILLSFRLRSTNGTS